MIQLFLSDIDGCLSVPYQPWDLARLAELAALATEPHAPRLGICTGRSYSYAEAVAQALDARGPVLFESGAGWFDLASAATRWHPALTDDVRDALAEARRFLERTLVPRFDGLSVDHAKQAQAGFVAPSEATIEAAMPEVEAFVAEQLGGGFHVFHTEVSVDVVPEALTKANAMRWVADEEALPLSALAFIGDTGGDIEALETVGHGFAPANATHAVRSSAARLLDGAVLEGTLEAFRWCMSYNVASSTPIVG
ncbi:MAG: HAD hydrolase family protein [Bacteroidota bacterium]